jgi:Tetrahydrofolate dehydrogenase/cyclohydrolase, NAD(P)-binding domain
MRIPAHVGLSPINVGRMLMRGVLPTYSPCPALACIELLKRSNIPIHNKKARHCLYTIFDLVPTYAVDLATVIMLGLDLKCNNGMPIARRHLLQVVVIGDSNTVGLPLAVLFRDNGAAAVTICHRVAYDSYEESLRDAEAAERAQAQACLPPISGSLNLSNKQFCFIGPAVMVGSLKIHKCPVEG